MNTVDQDPASFEFLICDISNLWRKLLTCSLKEKGITISEWRVLYAITSFPGSTQVQISQFVDLEPQSLTRILDHLEQQNLIEKHPSLKDRRAKCLFGTHAANRILEQVKQIGYQSIRPHALHHITLQQTLELTKILNTMKLNLVKYLAEIKQDA